MGLSWQQGPLSSHPAGTLVSAHGPVPERVLCVEPLRRRMSAVFAGQTVARSDDVVLVHEPARYPVAYFPRQDIAARTLKSTERITEHPDLGPTRWYTVLGPDGRSAPRAAWEHTDPPAGAEALRDTVAFAWRAMDAFYEEDERILGHAADPYHRIDIRSTHRHLTVHADGQLIADTTAPLVLYESGFAPRWYVPPADITDGILRPVDAQTFCPYKGVASYYDVAGAERAAWSYRSPFDDMARIAEFVSFEPDKVDVTLDGERLLVAAGQTVVAHGIDRDLTVDEAGAVLAAACPERPLWP